MLSSKQKQQLKALAHSLKPIVHIGKGDVEEKVVTAVQKALFDHELIKVKLLESVTTQKQTAAETLANAASAELVAVIGKTIILYKPTDKPGVETIQLIA
jgi:RNA-binding protein